MQHMTELLLTLPGDESPTVCKVLPRVKGLLGERDVADIFHKNIPHVVLSVGDIVGNQGPVGFSTLLKKKEERAAFPSDVSKGKNPPRTMYLLMDSILQGDKSLVALTLTNCRKGVVLGTAVVQKVVRGQVIDSKKFGPHELVMC